MFNPKRAQSVSRCFSGFVSIVALSTFSAIATGGDTCVISASENAFSVPGVANTFGGSNAGVYTFAHFDGDLYVGGSFRTAGSAIARNIARWDGEQWSSLGDVGSTVQSMIGWDDGGGAALYITGSFTEVGGIEANRVAKWDGENWSALGNGIVSGSSVTVGPLAVFDDGSGLTLYAGRLSGGSGSAAVYKWDGTNWVTLPAFPGGGTVVRALTVFDDGTGEALYAGGHFGSGSEVGYIAKWDGTEWSALGSGLDGGSSGAGFEPGVYTLTVHDNGSGPALYVGGRFTSAGGQSTQHIARWDGSEWDTSIPVPGTSSNTAVVTLASLDDGTGARLYAGGPPSIQVRKWIEAFSTWMTVGFGLNEHTVRALTTFDDGTGPAVIAGGFLYQTSIGRGLYNIAKWTDDDDWSVVGDFGTGYSPDCYIEWGVNDFALFDAGDGPTLFATRSTLFSSAAMGNSNQSNRLVRWNESAWEEVPNTDLGGVSSINNMLVADIGDGPHLYARGSFTSISGIPASRIAKWDGDTWEPLGPGLGGVITTDFCNMVVFDDGGGPALYAANAHASIPTEGRIAKWDGSEWSPLCDENVCGIPGSSSTRIMALTVFDDGSGDVLYVAHKGQAGLKKWDGKTWTTIETLNIEASANSRFTMVVHDDGSGPAIYVGGNFSTTNGINGGVAKWDGTEWSTMNYPIGNTSDPVTMLRSLDLGPGRESILITSHGYAWDGEDWTLLVEHDPLQGINTAIVDTTGDDPVLWTGGLFTSAGNTPSFAIARWNLCPTEPGCVAADLNCDGFVDVFDILALLSNWGPCDECDECPADLVENCIVNVFDLLEMIANWARP